MAPRRAEPLPKKKGKTNDSDPWIIVYLLAALACGLCCCIFIIAIFFSARNVSEHSATPRNNVIRSSTNISKPSEALTQTESTSTLAPETLPKLRGDQTVIPLKGFGHLEERARKLKEDVATMKSAYEKLKQELDDKHNERVNTGVTATPPVDGAIGAVAASCPVTEMSTSISSVKRQYGQSEVERECDDDFGYGLIDRWRSTGKVYCKPSIPVQKGGTEVKCYRLQQSRHSAPDIFCDVHNLYVDFTKINGEEYEQAAHRTDAQRYYNLPAGSFLGVCEKTSEWNDKHFNNRLETIFPRNGFDGVGGSPPEGLAKVVEHDVFFMTRDGDRNLYHSSEDFVNAFITKEALGVDVNEAEVLMFDRDPFGPFLPIWSKVFSRKHPVTRVSTYRNVVQESPSKGRVLFKRAIFSIPGSASPICKDIRLPNPCFNVDIIRGYTNLVLDSLGYGNLKPPARNVITMVSRKPKPGQTQVARGVDNEDELMRAMEQAKDESTIVRMVDFSAMTFEEQVKVVRESTVLVGVHGAGMTHGWFVSDGGAVMEINCGTGFNYFRNIARWGGKHYVGWDQSIGGSVKLDVNKFMDGIRAASLLAQGSGIDHNGQSECHIACT